MDESMNPLDLARQVAVTIADDPEQVGDFVTTAEVDESVVDYRFECRMRGYEGWQWSVTLFHDQELNRWTIDESTLIPTDAALRPPAWVPWKDRLEPQDLSVTDSIGTPEDDERLEPGVLLSHVEDSAQQSESTQGEQSANIEQTDIKPTEQTETEQSEDIHSSAQTETEQSESGEQESQEQTVTQPSQSSEQDKQEAIETFELTRRRVMSQAGRASVAQRWYSGPRGPKSLSTKTARGNVCSTCGFFVPLEGQLGLMFGVCANKWSPDDARVVSVDHGCGEHSQIDPPEPSQLWIQTKPAFDNLNIDVLSHALREDDTQFDLIDDVEENQSNSDADISSADNPIDIDEEPTFIRRRRRRKQA